MTFSFIIFISFYFIVLSEEKLRYDVTPDKGILINSDDEELSQALLLIDILKSDYLQLLRQRSVNISAATPTVEQSTCAATTGLDNETSASSVQTTRNESVETSATSTYFSSVSASVPQDAALNKSVPWNSPMVHAAPLLPWRWSDLGTTRVYNHTMPFYHTRRPPQKRPYLRHRPWRRFFPDYYLYGVYPRRFYKNLATNKRLATLAPTTTTAVHTTSTTEGPTRITTLTASSNTTSKSLRTTNRGPTTRTQGTSKKHTFRKKTSKMYTKDPVEAEIAKELLKEFKLINVTPKTTRAKTSTIDSTSTE